MKPVQQPTLERPVCAAPCVLLMGHTGKCTASNGKQWVTQAGEQEARRLLGGGE